MKRTIITLVAGIVIGSATFAGAATALSGDLNYAGSICSRDTNFATPHGARRAILCDTGGNDYIVAISQRFVLVQWFSQACPRTDGKPCQRTVYYRKFR